MNEKFFSIGRVVGLIGVIVCLAAILLRLVGFYTVGGYSLNAMMQGGVALVVIGCFAMLQPRN
jgi:hypothetical protein